MSHYTNKDLIAALKIRTTDLKRYDDCFYYFFKEFWSEVVHDKYVDNFHIEYLCKELQASIMPLFTIDKDGFRGEKLHDLVINMPPSESKSLICSVMFPAWLWAIDPSLRFITASYNSDLSTALAVQSKDVITSSKYKSLYGVKTKIRDDIDSKGLFQNVSGGWRLSTSVGAKVTGFHCHVKIVDDANNPNDVGNPDLFDKDSVWYDTVLASRNIDEKVTVEIFVQQRVSFNDLTAHIIGIDRKKINHIVLPISASYAIKPPHLIKYYKDGLMNPSRKNWDTILDKQEIMGDANFDSQYGQSPNLTSGGLIDLSDIEELDITQCPPDLFGNPVLVTVDGAWKDTKTSDPSGILIGIPFQGDIYLINWINKRMNYNTLKDCLIEVYDRYIGQDFNSAMIVEDASSGTAIISELRLDTKMNIIQYPKPNTSKVNRFSSCGTIIKSKRIKIVKGMGEHSWEKNFKKVIYDFPQVKHDEAVDNLVMIIEEGIKKARDVVVYERQFISV